MVVQDSDHMSLVQRGGAEGRHIWERLRTLPPDDVATTIVSFEEQTRGWLARLARANMLERQMADYGERKLLLQIYCNIAVLDFDANAVREFERLRQTKIRLGTMDLKTPSIALSNEAILLTRNLADFGKVPEIVVEDWSY